MMERSRRLAEIKGRKTAADGKNYEKCRLAIHFDFFPIPLRPLRRHLPLDESYAEWDSSSLTSVGTGKLEGGGWT